MNLINALALSIGVLAVAATWLCLGTPYGLPVWALFIGWGSYYHCGGGTDSVAKSAINHIWGIVVATAALFVVGTVAGTVPVTSIIVGVSVVVLVLGAHLPLFSTIPAAVYGYASTAAFLLVGGVALTDPAALLSASLTVAIAMVLGNIFGLVSQKVAGALAAKE